MDYLLYEVNSNSFLSLGDSEESMVSALKSAYANNIGAHAVVPFYCGSTLSSVLNKNDNASSGKGLLHLLSDPNVTDCKVDILLYTASARLDVIRYSIGTGVQTASKANMTSL